MSELSLVFFVVRDNWLHLRANGAGVILFCRRVMKSEESAASAVGMAFRPMG